ncbi:MAG: 2-C-methyl-D-erythritol 4-phosphate cytidylyltransferase [Defluviitaleaceae bacterium]|nr:2-C-methyl-D-erythritol 4-phosphate cytidylyltransferase [Defluviitaleaceae bacterium]
MSVECVAIVVAFGGGARFGGAVSKQFVDLGGLPVLGHSLLAFERVLAVRRVVLVAGDCPPHFGDCPRGWRGWFEEIGISKPVEVISGGATRQQSVFAAVKMLESEGFSGIVLVHDAARPFVDARAVDEVLMAAKRHGAATLGTSVTDTIKVSDGGMIIETLPREMLYRVQTPQAFQAELLYRAHNEADGLEVYDDCQLVEKIGISPRIVAGSPLNIKITHEIDLGLAREILKIRKENV